MVYHKLVILGFVGGVLSVLGSPRLATQEDFKHKSYFMHRVNFSSGDNTDVSKPIYKYEHEILDQEYWWYQQNERFLTYPLPIYLADNASTLFFLRKHTVRSAPSQALDEDAWKSAYDGIGYIENELSSYPMTQRQKKPYLCKVSETSDGSGTNGLERSSSSQQVAPPPSSFTPYHFTVLGDSHTGIFDVASLRMDYMNAHTVYAASMYGLKNINSQSGATRIFREVINSASNERMRKTDDGLEKKDTTYNNILVFSIGDCDINGLGWQKYLLNETEGIERSLRVFGDFLKEYVEVQIERGGFDQVVLVLQPPPLVKYRGMAYERTDPIDERSYILPSLLFEDRIRGVAKFNEALKLFCEERQSYCSILDIMPKIFGHGEVFRPYIKWIQSDNHLLTQRTFGVMLEQLRATLDAKWCVDDGSVDEDDDDDDITSINNIKEEGPILEKVSLSSPDSFASSVSIEPHIGFEPVLFELSISVEGVLCNFIINVVHYLTPQQLVHEMLSNGKHIEFLGDQKYLNKFLFALSNNPESQKLIENTLVAFVGEGWGDMNRRIEVDEQFNYVSRSFVDKNKTAD